MVTKTSTNMIKLHTHLSVKNTRENEITRVDSALKYIH